MILCWVRGYVVSRKFLKGLKRIPYFTVHTQLRVESVSSVAWSRIESALNATHAGKILSATIK